MPTAMSPEQSTSNSFSLTVVHLGKSTILDFPTSATLSDLQETIATEYSIDPAQQKLIHKGKRLESTTSIPLNSLLPTGAKVLLLGMDSQTAALNQAAIEQRVKKHEAFARHKSHPPQRVRNTSTPTSSEAQAKENYRFHQIVPFGREIPHYEKRLAMLERLANDEAIRDVMVKREFAVAILSELHPRVDPTLLGLNKGAGVEIKLRILTDALDGLRSYTEVRKVAIHELAHNTFGPHDVKFNTLNSAITAEVKAYETAHGIKTSPDTSVWSPSSDAPGLSEEERRKRFDRRLDEIEVGTRLSGLEFTEEDEVEERRERARRAAEARLGGVQ